MIDACKLKLKYFAGDFIALNVGWLFFNIVRYYFLPEHIRQALSLWGQLTSANILLGQLIFPLAMVGLIAIWGGYQGIYFRSRIDDVWGTASVTFVGSVSIYFIALFNDNAPARMLNLEVIAILWGLLFVFLGGFRLVMDTIISREIRSGTIAFNTLIIGASRGAMQLANKIRNSGRGGFNIVGYVDTRTNHLKRNDLDLPVHEINDIEAICRQLDVKRIIICPSHGGLVQTSSLINRLFTLDTRLYIPADSYMLVTSRPRLKDITGELLVEITRTSASRLTMNLKRISDIIISGLTLVILSPLYLALAVAVKRDSPGPVIYSQERIGQHKRPFKIYKFRTMRTDAEESGPALSSLDDPRITRVGAFLRKYRLDELPQFWNVLKGDMSLVGPRPERDFYIRQIIERAPYYNLIHQVRPGITSWGMVKYGYATTVDEMIERLQFDLVYLDNVSLTVDLKILFHTVNTVLTGKGI